MKKIIFITLCCLSAGLTTAQHNNELYIKGAGLYITPGATVYVMGDVHLDGSAGNTGLLKNDGYLEVQGNFYTDAASTSNISQAGSTGVVHFNNEDVNSAENQFIKSNNGAQLTGNAAFYDVNFQNRSPEGLVYLDNCNVEVNNTLQFSTGSVLNRIRTAAATGTDGSAYSNYLHIDNTNTSALVNTGIVGDAHGYVEGRLRWTVANGNTYNFPVGLRPDAGAGLMASSYGNQLAELTTNSMVNAGPVVIESSFTRDIGGAIAGPAVCNFSSVDCVLDHGFWNLDLINGTLTSPAEYDVQVNPRNDAGSCTGALFYVLAKRANGGVLSDFASSYVTGQTDGNVCGVNDYSASSGTVPRTGFNNFSDFAVASTSSVLPIELISLEARPVENNYIDVLWATGEEVNAAGFDVLRSTDSEHFEKIGFVNAKGTNSSYVFHDYDVSKGIIYYYRLNQQDLDGSGKYTKIVSATLNPEGIAISNVYPNPASDNIVVVLHSADRYEVRIRAFNAIGQLIQDNITAVGEGTNTIHVVTRTWPVGTYLLQFSYGTGAGVTKKIAIER